MLRADVASLRADVSALDAKLYASDQRASASDQRVSALGDELHAIDQRVSALDAKLHAIDQRVSDLDAKLQRATATETQEAYFFNVITIFNNRLLDIYNKSPGRTAVPSPDFVHPADRLKLSIDNFGLLAEEWAAITALGAGRTVHQQPLKTKNVTTITSDVAVTATNYAMQLLANQPDESDLLAGMVKVITGLQRL